MKAELTVIALSAILIASIGATPAAFGQLVEAIVITTDKMAYTPGETIMVSGEVRDLLAGTPVSIQVIAANGNLVTIQQLDISPDKTFSVEITSGGPLWKSTGTYTIKALYGSSARTAETTFAFGAEGEVMPTPPEPPVPPAGLSIGVPGTEFSVGYEITGGSVVSVTPDEEANSLLIQIETTGDGELTITVPRGLCDSTLPTGEDDEYFVIVDGEEESEFDEVTTASDRTLTIPFPDGAEQIEIIGTMCIPEFGTIASLILAVAIISIIAISARTRLSLLPKH